MCNVISVVFRRRDDKTAGLRAIGVITKAPAQVRFMLS